MSRDDASLNLSRSYIVLCLPSAPTNDLPAKVVGPFESQEAAVEWAYEHRGNSLWDFRPDVMEAPR